MTAFGFSTVKGSSARRWLCSIVGIPGEAECGPSRQKYAPGEQQRLHLEREQARALIDWTVLGRESRPQRKDACERGAEGITSESHLD